MTTPTRSTDEIKLSLILYFAGALALLVFAMLLVCGCGAAPSPDVLDAGGDTDVDTDADTDSDVDSDSDSDTDTDSTTADRCENSCMNGTCDCGEDSDTCPLDCPAVWTACMEPHDARTCDEVCDRSPTLYCTESCPSTQELAGDPLLGFESCGDQPGYPYHVGGCAEAFAGPAEWGHCCCGREAE